MERSIELWITGWRNEAGLLSAVVEANPQIHDQGFISWVINFVSGRAELYPDPTLDAGHLPV